MSQVNAKGSVSQNNFNNQNSIGSFTRDKPINNFNEINVINEDEENEETYQNNDTFKETQKEDTKNNENNFNRNKQQPDIYLNKNLEAKSKNGEIIFFIIQYIKLYFFYVTNFLNLDFDSMYTNKIILNNKVSNNLFNEKDDNYSISSNNYGDRRRFLENNTEENNKFASVTLSKFPSNNYSNNYKNNQNRSIPSQNNQWEDSIHTKFKNLELTNDDLDDMFNVFSDNKNTNLNKK